MEIQHHINLALKAHIMHLERIMWLKMEIVIVEMNTGRLMEESTQRSLQAIEAKENVE